MTSFGGQTIPPLFGGLARDAIFIRSIGPVVILPRTGNPQQNITLPSRQIGDLLVAVIMSSNSTADPMDPPTNYVDQTAIPGGSLGLHTRVATNTVADNFTMASNGATPTEVFIQIISLATLLGSVVFIQGGPSFSGNSFPWEVPAMTVGPNANDTLFLSLYNRFVTGPTGSIGPEDPPQFTDPGNATSIGRHTSRLVNGGSTFLFWCGWGFSFQSVSAAVPLITLAGILPTTGIFIPLQKTQNVRFGIL